MASPDVDIVGNSQNRKHPPLSALVDLDRERAKLAQQFLRSDDLIPVSDPAAAELTAIIEREKAVAARETKVEAQYRTVLRQEGKWHRAAKKKRVAKPIIAAPAQAVAHAPAIASPVVETPPEPSPPPACPAPPPHTFLAKIATAHAGRIKLCPDCLWTGPAEDYRYHRRDDH